MVLPIRAAASYLQGRAISAVFRSVYALGRNFSAPGKNCQQSVKFEPNSRFEELGIQDVANPAEAKEPEAMMSLSYTCGRCGSREKKSFAKMSYHNGVVIVRCGGCEALHLVADNLGWFPEEEGPFRL